MTKNYSLILLISLIFYAVSGLAESLNTVTVDTLNKRIEVVTNSQEYDTETQEKLIQLYRDSISYLHLIETHTKATDEFQQVLLTAPKEIATLKNEQEQRLANDPLAGLKILQFANQEKLEKQISDEEFNRSESEEKLSAINTQIETRTLRPSQARARINTVRLKMIEINERRMDQQVETSPAFTEADSWYWDTKYQSLQTELTMLDKELVSNNILLNQLREQQQNETTVLNRIETRIAFLRDIFFNLRVKKVQQISESANAVLNSALAENSYLSGIAKQNLELIDLLQAQIHELQTLSEKDNKERKLTLAVSEAFHNARKRLQLQSDSSLIAFSIRAQRDKLPDSKEYKKLRKTALDDIAKISIRLFHNEEMLNKNAEEQLIANNYLSENNSSVEDGKMLSELLDNRKKMLGRAIANDQILQLELYDLAGKYLQLKEKIENYDSYLTEHLLWIQSSHAFNYIIFGELPSEIKQYVIHLTEELWTLKELSLRYLLFLFLPLSLAALLIVSRNNLLIALTKKGQAVGHVKYDTILHTINALIYTILIALPWPLILLSLSWSLKLSTTASIISVQFANAGIYTAISLFAVQLIKTLCIEKGVVEIHFKRDIKGLLKFVKQLKLFIYLAIPCYFITLSAISLFPATLGGSLAILSYTVVLFTFVIIIISILHPSNGLIYQENVSFPNISLQTKKFIFIFVMFIPIAIIIMCLAGYIYTAGVISERLYYSIFFAAVIWIVHSLSSRWLLITSKRLAFDNLIKARKAKYARLKVTDNENTELSHDDPLEQEIDLKTLDGDTQKLINAATLVLSVAGLFAIWGQMLPALSFLEHVDLWNKTLIVDGKELTIAVTMGELLAALLIALAGYILSQNLPSLLNILILKGGKVSPGARYAIVTLTRYCIVIISILITMNLLGISSSKLGWMFAALSVGIGFGLQEIVANFICGLILLFERPIRVGDVISIGSAGDSSGTVIRIRIRATTIRDFDEKELLIPNKELITGRVLNWTLSDEITRIFINVGIAYGSDVELAMTIIEEVAIENENTLDEPAPFVNFEKFADSSLSLTLRAYVPKQRDRLRTITQIHKEIDRRFRIANINIAFPQQDVHIISHETVKSTD